MFFVYFSDLSEAVVAVAVDTEAVTEVTDGQARLNQLLKLESNLIVNVLFRLETLLFFLYCFYVLNLNKTKLKNWN